jgi:hypothetical protein
LWHIAGPVRAQVKVVNMIPVTQSAEQHEDSEPNLAVNPANPRVIAGTAFTSTPPGSPNAPVYVSFDGGNTWVLRMIVPSNPGDYYGTYDITLRFSPSSLLYAGILRAPTSNMEILRTSDLLLNTPMTILTSRPGPDQPFVQASSLIPLTDRVYVGNNDLAVTPRSATVDESQDTATIAAVFNSVRIEQGTVFGQDNFQIRPAIHPDGTIYSVFYRRTGPASGGVKADVVLVRDDNWGAGATPFQALGVLGQQVASGVTIPINFAHAFGQERIGGDLAIAVDPRNHATVYICWADRVGSDVMTLHVQRSTDSGQTWPGPDLITIHNAKNAGLAVNSSGKIGLLYQQVTGTAPSNRWETHIRRSADGGGTWDDFTLATTPANAPAADPLIGPYLGDYDYLLAIGNDFYGIFCANNTPDMANFPNGVSYQRYANFTTHTLFADAAMTTPVPISIDPFFFKVTEPVQPTILQYAAKFVCGEAEDESGLAEGRYFTAINVHNPLEKAVAFHKKIAFALPEEKSGPVSKFFDAKLGPDGAFQMDCKEIRRMSQAKGGFFEGFVVIESEIELDVVAVYSAAGAVRRVETLELERLLPRRVPGH